MEWLEWHYALGVDRVHAYISLPAGARYARSWSALQRYARDDRLTVHHWSNRDSHGVVAKSYEQADETQT